MSQNYKTIFSGGTAEIIEKKSRFIATVRPVLNKEEAEAFLAEMKKKYWDATHNCFACVAGENNEYMRSNDDGEPSGTAGKPMLEVLVKEEIRNAAIVVTRYFGGTLLGTGGLVRAYQLAAKEGLLACEMGIKEKGQIIKVKTNYNDLGKLQYMFAQKGYPITDSQYGVDVELSVLVPNSEAESCKKAITEATSANAQAETKQHVLFANINGKLTIF